MSVIWKNGKPQICALAVDVLSLPVTHRTTLALASCAGVAPSRWGRAAGHAPAHLGEEGGHPFLSQMVERSVLVLVVTA